MSKLYKFYSDDGHGWLAVKRQDLIELDIESSITAWSYESRSGHTVYLEEDCDMSLFFKVYEAKHGTKPQLMISNIDGRSSIRSYPAFKSVTKKALT